MAAGQEGALAQAPQKAVGGIGGLFARLRHAPPWVWIAIAVAAVGVVIAYMSYRKQQAAANGAATSSGQDTTGVGAVPAGGSGQPIWPSGDPGGMGGFGQTGNLAELLALLQYLQSLQTPNPPPTAKPPIPTTRPPGAQPPVPIPGGNGNGGSLGIIQGQIVPFQPWQQGRTPWETPVGGFRRAPAQQQTPPLPAPATGGTVPPGSGIRNLIRKPPVRV